MTGYADDPGRRTWKQWSCSVSVTVSEPVFADEAAALVTGLMDEVDLAVSRFRADSELAVCNQRAGRATLVSPLTAQLVATGLRAARHTDGLVDPTIGRHLDSAGYDRDIDDVRAVTAASASGGSLDSGRPPAVRLPKRPPRLPGWRNVVLDQSLGLVIVPQGLGLDLGATAKAWTADRAAELLAARVPGRVLVEIGGDLAVAGAIDVPFVVRVSERAGDPGELVSVAHGGLATSTTVVRRWGPARHHIIDPRTGWPSRGRWRTATVWGRTAVVANAASTAAIVAGDQAVPWLEEHGYAARLVDNAGAITYTAGWPTEEAVAS